jgi:hypothetical protein
VGKPEGRRLLGQTRKNKKIILKCILKEAEREIMS